MFNSFYLKLTLLNYRYRSKLDFTPDQLNTLKLLKLIIPIFNRLEENDTLTIDDVKNFKPNESETIPSVVTTIHNNSLKEQETSTEDDVEDPEGDKQIEELTKKALEQLETIRNRGWILVQLSDDDNEEGEDETIETYNSGDESTAEYVSDDDTIPSSHSIHVEI